MKASKIIKFILMALACVGLVIIVVSLAAFKYSVEQTNSAIYKDLSLKTGQDTADLSVTTLVVMSQNNVMVVVFQYNGTDGVETGTAIFSKLPLLSQYRYDRLYWGGNSRGAAEVATVIDTGLTNELVVASGTDISISTAGLGTASRSLLWIALIFLIQIVTRKIYALDMKPNPSPAEDADSLQK